MMFHIDGTDCNIISASEVWPSALPLRDNCRSGTGDEDVSELLWDVANIRLAHDRAVQWLAQHVEKDGSPRGVLQGQGWARLSWALADGGESAAAAAHMEWAARHGIDSLGGFQTATQPPSTLLCGYYLGQLCISALVNQRYDMADRIFGKLEALQDSYGGTLLDAGAGPAMQIADLCSTAQVGLCAIIGGRHELAMASRNWIVDLLDMQPELPRKLYTGRIGGDLVTQPPQGLEWLLAVDYSAPRQAYYYSGIAAAFLATFASRYGDDAALQAGHRYLSLNIAGTGQQFDDLSSVQACKFGWGLARMQIADPTVDYTQDLRRMAGWFLARQQADGSWIPSAFQSQNPTLTERMMKTAEHSVQLSSILAALAAAEAAVASGQS